MTGFHDKGWRRARTLVIAAACALVTAAPRAQEAPLPQAPCLEAVLPLLGNQVFHAGIGGLLRSPDRRLGPHAGWKPGQAHYEQAHALVERTAEADQAVNGRWSSLRAQTYLSLVFGGATPQEFSGPGVAAVG